MYRIFSIKTKIILLLFTIITIFPQIKCEGHKSSLLDEDTDELDFEGKVALVRDVPIRMNDLVPHLHHVSHEGHSRRYKCLSCEPPDCADSALGTHTCQNAVACWKSIVRDGEFSSVFFRKKKT